LCVCIRWQRRQRGLLMVLGPRKLIRWGSAALPWILKLQQRARG
jgi:hypothetical protein